MNDLNPIRGLVRLSLFLVLTLTGLILAVPARFVSQSLFERIRMLWCLGVCRILGIHVDVQGDYLQTCPTVIVANHISYLDIPIIGASTTATFIAKSEVANWPLFGILAKLSRTMFIRRYWRDALFQRNALKHRLLAGESFVLFPEGTSSNGLDVGSFKSSLLSVAEPWVMDKPIAVQPMTLAYRCLKDGTPIDARCAELYAWIGEARFLPHLWQVLQLPGVEVSLRFGPPVMSWSVRCRKVLARQMHNHVSDELVRIRNQAEDRTVQSWVPEKIKEA